MHPSCTVCASPERDAIDASLVAGLPLREIAGVHGLSASAVHRHRAGGHIRDQHHEAPDNSTTANAPDPNGPWIHLKTLDALATAVIHALPENARTRVIDALDQLPEADYVRDHIAASLDPDTARRGEIDVMTRVGDEWRPTRFKNGEAFNDHMRDLRPTAEAYL